MGFTSQKIKHVRPACLAPNLHLHQAYIQILVVVPMQPPPLPVFRLIATRLVGVAFWPFWVRHSDARQVPTPTTPSFWELKDVLDSLMFSLNAHKESRPKDPVGGLQ